jgi:hypothetical protein
LFDAPQVAENPHFTNNQVVSEIDFDSYGRRPRYGMCQCDSAPSFTTRTAFWLASSRLHLCAMNCFWMWAYASLRSAYSLGICRELGIAIFTHAKHRNIILSFDDPKLAFRHAQVSQRADPIAWRERVKHGIRNGQACVGENAVNDLFSAIVVQRVQRIAPAREVATQELGLVPCGIFLVLGMEGLQKKFALCCESIDSFCILY